MSRAVHLQLSEAEVVQLCTKHSVGISALEALVSGGTRLVTMSADGAETIRHAVKGKLIKGEVKRAPVFLRTGRW